METLENYCSLVELSSEDIKSMIYVLHSKCMVLRNDEIINEINTMPGFTRTSAYPKMWQATGIGYSEVITHLLKSALPN